MDKLYLLLAISLILLSILIIFETEQSEKNIILSCNFDMDCHKTCSGCISKNSAVSGQACDLPLSSCKCVKNSCQYILSEEELMDIVDEKFPGTEKDASLDINCKGGPCWKVNFTLGNASGAGGGGAKITVDADSGEIIEAECDNEACKECSYLHSELTPWGSIKYYNFGCENPKPICDLSNLCRPCESIQECLRKNLSSTMNLDIGKEIIKYEYSLLGTGLTAKYNEADSVCTVYDNDMEIYSETLADVAACEEKIMSYISCNGGCIRK